MFERFTERAVVVLLLSQCSARLLGHYCSEPEDLLIGLSAVEPGGLAGTILREVGGTKGAIYSAYVSLFGPIDSSVGVGVLISSESFWGEEPIPSVQLVQSLGELEVPFSELTKGAIEAAWAAAAELKQNYVDTEHLLLGMLSIKGGRHLQVLTNLQIDAEELGKIVRKRSLGHGG